jgi:nucleotide-binding universal stress UspA family protein
MAEPIVVGFDASPESGAAADWAAREAARRGLPLELVQAWPWPTTEALGSADAVRWGKDQLARKEAELQARHPGVAVSGLHLPDTPSAVLEGAAKAAVLLVLGSRGLGAVKGFLIGSVSQEVVGRAGCPVVLVRAGRTAEDEHLLAADGTRSADTPYRAVAVGLDLAHPCEEVLAFAFESAALRTAPLRVVHAWGPPHGGDYMAFSAIGQELQSTAPVDAAVADALRPWRDRYPQVEVAATTVVDSAAVPLLDAAREAGLLVVGRRNRHLPVGAHLGPVTHAAIHHAPCPVAVVPYG